MENRVRSLAERMMPAAQAGPPDNLSRRALVASGWNLGLNIAGRALSTVRVVVLARLLAPEDFGMFSIALVAMATLEAFSSTGVNEALVQRPGNAQQFYDTAWTIQAMRGVALGLGVFVLAGPIARFFSVPGASSLIRLLGVVPVLQGFVNIGAVSLQKNLEFHKQFFWSVSETLADLVASIGLAIWLESALALMAGLITGRIVRLALSYWIDSYRPRFRFRNGEARELVRFGRWITLNNMLMFVILQGDNVLVGKVLGPVALGIYDMGWKISEVLTRSLSTVVGSIAFPAYSQVQGESERLRRGFLIVLSGVSNIVLPAAAFVATLANPLVNIALGGQWAPVSILLPFLAWSGALRAVSSTAGALFKAIGRPGLDFGMNSMRAVVMFALIIPLMLRLGVAGVGIAVLAGSMMTIPSFIWLVASVAKIGWGEVWRALAPGSLLALTVVVASTGVARLGIASPVLLLSITFAVVGCACLVLSSVLWAGFRVGPIEHVLWVRRRLLSSSS